MPAPTIYFAAGEDEAFTTIGTTSVDTTSTHRRTAYCRCGLLAPDGFSYWDTGTVMSVASAWFHARAWVLFNSGGAGSATAPFGSVLRIQDGAGITRLALNFTSAAASSSDPTNWAVFKVNAAGTFAQIGPVLSGIFSASPASPDAIDVQVASYGASGTINIWINRSLVYSFTGDVHTDANTTVNGLRLSASCATIGNRQIPITWSEVIVSDSDTRGMSLGTLTPAADGNTDNWDIGGVTNINELVEDDTTLNASGTPGQIQQYTTNALPSGTFGVIAVVISGRMMAGSVAGPTKVDFGVRTAGVDHWSADVTLPTSLATVQNVFMTDPGTSAPFDPTVLGTGFNVGLKSVA